jgi:hypothetical protein
MGIAAAAFHWTPDIFWNSTPHEYWAAYEVYREMHKPPGS